MRNGNKKGTHNEIRSESWKSAQHSVENWEFFCLSRILRETNFQFLRNVIFQVVWQSLARSRARRDLDLRDRSRETQEKSLATKKLVQKWPNLAKNDQFFHQFQLQIVISTDQMSLDCNAIPTFKLLSFLWNYVKIFKHFFYYLFLFYSRIWSRSLAKVSRDLGQIVSHLARL